GVPLPLPLPMQMGPLLVHPHSGAGSTFPQQQFPMYTGAQLAGAPPAYFPQQMMQQQGQPHANKRGQGAHANSAPGAYWQPQSLPGYYPQGAFAAAAPAAGAAYYSPQQQAQAQYPLGGLPLGAGVGMGGAPLAGA